MASPRLRQFLVLAAGAALALLVPASPAAAQLDPGNFDIRQRGTVVGHIFVPAHLSPALYVEHWIVSRSYVYPSSRTPVATEIVPSDRIAASEQESFRQVDFGPGSRYIRVLAQDSGTLPKAGGEGPRGEDHAGLLGRGQVLFWAVAATGGVSWRLAVRGFRLSKRTSTLWPAQGIEALDTRRHASSPECVTTAPSDPERASPNPEAGR